MTAGLFELAIVVLIAAVLGFFAKILRQPIVLAYLVTGIIVGYLNFFNVQSTAAFHIFSDLGIMFLLFLVGLEINYASLRIVGKTSAIIGVSQVALTTAAGYGLAHLLGFPPIQAGYLAVAFTLSSTIIVVKLLSEKRDLNSLYGRITVGILLVQDFCAILLLVILAGVEANHSWSWLALLMTVLKGAGLFALMLWLGRKVMPYLFGKISRSSELLFLFTLAWVFLLAALVNRIGFSIEIAGFLAGLALANSSEHFQIAAKIRPLRDFFILIFFVILGSSVVIGSFEGLTLPIAVFTGFVLIANPLIVIVVMGIMGYKKRTGLMTGLTMGQISEFSLVLVALGERLRHIDASVVSIVTAVGINTIIISCYLITHSESIFRVFSRVLSLFERANPRRDVRFDEDFHKPVIVIGAHRTGQNLVFSIPKKDLLVIDFDPEVALMLQQQGFDCLFGDALDPEIFERANFDEAKLVISTSPDFQDNAALLAALASLERRPKVVVRAESEEEAKMLYEAGANYVLLPHFTSGQYLGKTIAIDPEADILESLKKKDLELMHKYRLARDPR
jgi:Kef-type K+ transport system membrane component KefB/voltage-gated potassium channel Kch